MNQKIDPKFQSGFLHLELFTLPDEPLFKKNQKQPETTNISKTGNASH